MYLSSIYYNKLYYAIFLFFYVAYISVALKILDGVPPVG